jgi:hypothetical protein
LKLVSKTSDGKHFILAANFRSGRIEDLRERGFAPFNVQGLGPNINVTYAKQDAARHDPVGGSGLGFVNVFSSHGRLL